MNDHEFAARLQALDERHEQFFRKLEESDQRWAESRQRYDERLEESDRKWAESQRRHDARLEEFEREWAESDRRFKERLDLYDQRDTAFLQRMERLAERVDLLSAHSGQIADDLVEHKRDRDAHG